MDKPHSSRAAPVPSAVATGYGGPTDWDVYLFGLRVGWLTLRAAPRAALKRLILPLEYVRCAEVRYVLQHLRIEAGHSVLDIGSPKLLSLFLAARTQAQVVATDLLDYFCADYGVYAARTLRSHRQRYRMEVQDARALTYAHETFDRVFSISAVEHIPEEGDSLAMREIARVLKPGGVACLTVPWSDSGYREEFKRRGDPDAYWIPAGQDTGFYQRAYDPTTLESRIVRPSGLQLVDMSFWGERRVPVEHVIINRRLPRIVRWAMLPAHFVLSRVFLTRLTADEPSRKKVACLTLQKPQK